MKPYVVLGHGREKLHKSGARIPPGCMLVISEECGALGSLHDTVLDELQNPKNRKLFKDPVTHRRTLERKLKKRIKIYREGDVYPDLIYSLLANFEHDFYDRYEASGVWPLPIAPGALIMNPTANASNKYFVDKPESSDDSDDSNFSDDGIDNTIIFRGSVYPTIDQVRDEDSPFKMYDPDTFKITQAKLFEMFPGIYYNFICRGLYDGISDGKPEYGHDFLTSLHRNFSGNEKPPEYNMFNMYPVIHKWAHTVKRPKNPELRSKLKIARNITTTVLARRIASRSSSNNRRRNEFEAWTEVRNLIMERKLIIEDKEKEDEWKSLIDEIPDEQIDHIDYIYNSTLLGLATEFIEYYPVKLLLARGANPNSYLDTNSFDEPNGPIFIHILRRALKFSKKPEVIAIFDLFINPSLPRLPTVFVHNGQTVFDMVFNYNYKINHHAFITKLVTIGANPNLLNANGQNALFNNVRRVETLSFLLDSGADVTVVDKEGYTPFLHTIAHYSRNNKEDIIKRYLYHFQTIEQPDLWIQPVAGTKRNALILAIEANDEKTALFLLWKGFPVKNWKKIKLSSELPELSRIAQRAIAITAATRKNSNRAKSVNTTRRNHKTKRATA